MSSEARLVRISAEPRTRAEKTDETRRALFDAAAAIVGKHGYANASIMKITARANVANGTFYNYFESRQDLFDQLLPTLGEQLLESIQHHVDTGSAGIERESERIRAYFAFCEENPGFLRILNEAEVFAPKAFRRHVRRFADGYVRAMRRSHQRGEMLRYSEDEFETIAYMLMGARTYLTMLHNHSPRRKSGPSVTSTVETYLKFVERALFA
jgi:AcrR family transcriptional regulator